jgi:hypothetical protein
MLEVLIRDLLGIAGLALLVGGLMGIARPTVVMRWIPPERRVQRPWLWRLNAGFTMLFWIATGAGLFVCAWHVN